MRGVSDALSSAIRLAEQNAFLRRIRWKVRSLQGALMLRSCAIKRCEPCQGLTAAALSRFWCVPWGNFEGVTYYVTTAVWYDEDSAQYINYGIRIGRHILF